MMSIAELSIANITMTQPRRARRSYQSGKTFVISTATPCVRVRALDFGEPKTGCLTSDALLLTWITSLPDTRLRVVQPIPVTVKQLEHDNFLAQMSTANVNASGDSIDEAVDNLMDMLGGTYDLLSSLPRSSLGPGPAHDFSVLRQHITR